MPASAQILFDPFEAQEKFCDAFWSLQYNRLMLGGSIRSGKTYVTLAILIALCKIFPRSKWLVVRKDWPRLRATTMEAFGRICPTGFVKKPFNQQTREVVFKNDSRMIFMNESPGLDKEIRFRGLYINGALCDEMDELAVATTNAIKSRLGSWKESWAMSKEGEVVYPPAFLMGTCNPNQGWIKDAFYTPSLMGNLADRYYFQNITIRENPYITEDDLAEFSDWPEELLTRFIDGSWDAMDAEKQLISWQHINAAEKKIPCESDEYSLGVDVARQGKDKLIYLLLKGSNIERIEEHPFTENTMEIVSRVEWYMSEFDMPAERVCIDAVGVGQGVVDRLFEKRLFVCDFVGGSKATQEWGSVFHFKNLKAQAYWELKEAFRNKQIGGVSHNVLKSELAAVWYYSDEKEIKVDAKEDYKLRNGKSPDFADALVYAWHAKVRNAIGLLEPIIL